MFGVLNAKRNVHKIEVNIFFESERLRFYFVTFIVIIYVILT